MSFLQLETMSITTDASSAASQTSTGTYTGFLHLIHYTRSSTATAMSTTMGITVTAEGSSMQLFAAQVPSTTVQQWMPRGPVHESTAGGTTAAGNDRLPLVNERFTVALSSGGAAKTGTFRFYID